jgi:hypothetical protein
MNRQKVNRALLRTSAVVGAAGVGLVLVAGPAGADTVTTLSPSSNFTDGQVVQALVDSGVPFTGLIPGPIDVFECTSTATPTPATCIVLAPGTFQYDASQTAGRGEDTWSGPVTVHKTINAVTCTNQCYLQFGVLNPTFVQVGNPAQLVFKAPK